MFELPETALSSYGVMWGKKGKGKWGLQWLVPPMREVWHTAGSMKGDKGSPAVQRAGAVMSAGRLIICGAGGIPGSG